MLSVQEKELPLEHFARSPGGLWVKAVRTPTEIGLFWQPRFEFEGHEVRVIDANGDIESVTDVATMDYGDPYRSAGSINLTNELVEFCGVDKFPQFIVALMKHSANLLAGGYGETPEDIVEGFNRQDFCGCGGDYIFVGEGMKPFVGLEGNSAWFREVENSTKPGEFTSMVDIEVNGEHFDHVVDGNSDVVAFLCSTIPVI